MMNYWHLNKSSQDALCKLPETGLGFQLVDARVMGERKVLLVLGNDIAIDPGMSGIEFSNDPNAVIENGIKLMSVLNDIDRVRLLSSPEPSDFKLLQMRIAGTTSTGKQTPPIGPPLVTQSSLVKKIVLQNSRVFHRFSAYSTDRRVDPITGSFIPGTYATPDSEIPFLPTGFAVVGRLALPNNQPASHHYEIKAPVGTVVEFGTVAPAFGQAGGGVEAFFPNGANNLQSRMKNPIKIPDE